MYGKVREAERGDKGVAILRRIERQAAKQDRAVLAGFLEQLVAMSANPIGRGGERGAGRVALKRQREGVVVIGLLTRNGNSLHVDRVADILFLRLRYSSLSF